MEGAGEAVRSVTAAGLLPAGMEIMDNYTINAVDDFFGCDEYPRDAAAVLLIELDGQEAEVQASAHRAEQLCREAGAPGLTSGGGSGGMCPALEGSQVCVFSGGQDHADVLRPGRCGAAQRIAKGPRCH